MRFPKVSTTNINGLPLGYTEVEYLEGSGTQYIDTGFKPNNNTEYEVSGYMNPSGVFGVARWSGESTYDTFGAHSVTANPLDYYGRYSDNKYYNGPSSVFNKNIVWKHTKYNISIKNIDNGTVYVNENIVTATFQSTYNMWIFGFNNMGTILARSVGCKIYHFKIWDNGKLIRDYIPCLDSNNRPCMYDKVEGKPYYNLGTGEFSYGKKIYGVEYLESTGTQYIDTGIKPLNTMGIHSKFYIVNPSDQVHAGWKQDNVRYYSPYCYSTTQVAYGWNSFNNVNYTLDTTKIHESWLNFNNDRIAKIDDYTLSSSLPTLTNVSINQGLLLFGYFGEGVIQKRETRLYSLQISNNNEIVRDYVPVHDENNVGYMFDRVEHILYENKGTGAFVIGGDTLGKSKAKIIRTKTTVSGLPSGYTEVEYLEGSGTQYIDTGYIPYNNSEIEIVCNSGGVQGTNLFGYRNASASSKNITITTSSTGTTVFYTIDFNNSNYNTYRYNFESNANQILKLKLSKSERSVYNTSGTLLGGNSVSCPDVFTCDSTAYLMNVAGTPFFTQCFKGKVYGCKISEAGVLIRDYIPALDSNNRPCMYDKVDGKAYYNLGTGEFTYGPKIIPVKYIENTASSYIDTGYKPNSNTKVEAKFVMKENTTTFKWLFLARNENAAGSGYGFGAATNGVIASEYNNRQADTAKFISGQTYIITKDKNICKYNDSSLTNPDATFTVNYPLPIFALNNIGTIQSGTMPLAECHYFKIYDNNTLVRDYIPVKNENGVGYMFDKIGHTLYANAGTGSFVVGDEKKLYKTNMVKTALVPAGYTRVKYLESSGVQYIDTGILPGSYSKAKIGFEWKDGNIGYDKYIIGSVSSASMRYYFGTYQSKWQYGYCGSTNQAEGIEENKYYDVYVTWDPRNQLVVLNGETIITNNNATDTTSDNTFALFGRHQGNSFNPAWLSKSKIYYCKIYTGTTIVRDYIPVIRNSDNKPGMWDRVSKTFFTNGGSGDDFTYESL